MKAGFQVEQTGGGCSWLRRGSLAISDGECGIPEPGEPCVLLTLDSAGDYLDEGKPFPSLEAALAYVRFLDTHYSTK